VQEDAEKILKAAEDACFVAMFEIHEVARRHNRSIAVEAGGIPIET
tara:strand:- start:522 stop:659 length:138 start_codon:yes stop_codon:yes gene_type:complete